MDLLLTLSVSLGTALVLGYLTQRLSLSPIVGYLLAGIVVGPNTPGIVANPEIAAQLANIGIVLLMFGVGLHIDPRELLALRRTALPGAAGQSLVATVLGAAAALALGHASGWAGALLYGLALSVASTVAMTRVLADHDEMHTPAGQLAMSWSIAEDLLTVLILILLPAVIPGGAEARGSLLASLGLVVLKLCALLVLLFLIAARIVPWLLRRVAATRSRELFTLTVLAVALGVAFGSSRLFGVSLALGAFLAGTVVGRTDFSLRAATEALPMRDAFAVLFFVSVGMLLDPLAVVRNPALFAATLVIVMLAKPLVIFAFARVLGQPRRTALSVGLVLAQIGEFSFILAGVGGSLGLLPRDETSAIIAAAIVSIALNPLVHRLSRAGRFLRLAAPKPASARVGDAEVGPVAPADEPRYRAVLVGYGPVGRTLVQLLLDHGISCTVIEMNLDTVHRLRSRGVEAVYGDAVHPETLRRAGIQRAGNLIVSAAGPHSGEIIRIARELNSGLRILARTAYLDERSALQAAGADLVISGEGEVAMAMNDAVLRDMGASAGKISRERRKLRDRL